MSAGERGPAGDVARWLISGAIVLAVHGGAAAMLSSFTEPLPPGVDQPAVLLDLDQVAAAPPAPDNDVAPAPQDSTFVPEAHPTEKVEKEDIQPPEKVVEPQPDPPPDPPEQVAEQEPDPAPPEPPMKPAEVVLPKPAPPKPKPFQKKKQMASIDQRRAHQPNVADRVTSASAGAMSAVRATYNQMIVAHLNRHKSYPAAARSAGIEGSVMLAFTLNRSGNVVSSHIARGSGNSELDREALATLRRAQPFPAPPPEYVGAQFSFVAPMRYNLTR